jgi:hypothetical protein
MSDNQLEDSMPSGPPILRRQPFRLHQVAENECAACGYIGLDSTIECPECGALPESEDDSYDSNNGSEGTPDDPMYDSYRPDLNENNGNVNTTSNTDSDRESVIFDSDIDGGKRRSRRRRRTHRRRTHRRRTHRRRTHRRKTHRRRTHRRKSHRRRRH